MEFDPYGKRIACLLTAHPDAVRSFIAQASGGLARDPETAVQMILKCGPPLNADL
jgi:hypothetical protein